MAGVPVDEVGPHAVGGEQHGLLGGWVRAGRRGRGCDRVRGARSRPGGGQCGRRGHGDGGAEGENPVPAHRRPPRVVPVEHSRRDGRPRTRS
ncbi:hypothetical protein E1262_20700 [Jiangella aurantiaca]|uniref:Uncharacterized protein n=1 Tax=Jiangella aurantiaca TaxID=2530373 RepID=A0A4V2YRU6_9ACTN|nr:hypothetical protein E1262_20700 [Jiangella aurantiaca]